MMVLLWLIIRSWKNTILHHQQVIVFVNFWFWTYFPCSNEKRHYILILLASWIQLITSSYFETNILQQKINSSWVRNFCILMKSYSASYNHFYSLIADLQKNPKPWTRHFQDQLVLDTVRNNWVSTRPHLCSKFPFFKTPK